MHRCSGLLATAALALAGCQAPGDGDIVIAAGLETAEPRSTINGDIEVADGASALAGLSSVNGRILVGSQARVGRLETINGPILVGDVSETGDIRAVNGDLRTGRDVKVRGNVAAVNGRIRCDPGSTIAGDLHTVNGEIRLHRATVEGDVSNYGAPVLITDGSTVKGSLVVRRTGRPDASPSPQIVIGPDSRVLGKLSFERPVKLWIHESAEVGEIDGAEPEFFATPMPGS